jgi:hypothetical protein
MISVPDELSRITRSGLSYCWVLIAFAELPSTALSAIRLTRSSGSVKRCDKELVGW